MPFLLRLVLCLCACAAAVFPAGLHGQEVHARNPGKGVLPLDQPWHFHVGDDPRWADPRYNDAGWELLSPGATWGAQGHDGYTGLAWYRLHVDIQGPGPELSLFLPAVDDNYEVFLNGQPLGTYGGFPPHAKLSNASPGEVFALPSAGGQVNGVLAIRVWKMQLSSNDGAKLGGFEAVPVVGSTEMVYLLRDATVADHDHHFVLREMLSSVVLVAGLICLVLYLRGANESIFLYLAVYLIADASSALLTTLFWFHFSFGELQLLNAVRVTACNIALWWALLYLFGMAGLPRWRRMTWILSLAMFVSETIDLVVLLFWQFDHPSFPWIDGITTMVYTLLPAYMFAILYGGIRRHPRLTFWPLAVAVSGYGMYNILIDSTAQGQRFTGLHVSALDNWSLSLGGYPIGIRSLLDVLFTVALLLTVARQQATERRRRAALELELKSAQEIQQVLVPDSLPQVAGFSLEAIYRPAQEVGGDFFQLLPTAQAGLLLVLGDVSGKGLKAAMTVSLIVGAIRTLAESSVSPAELLSGLNRRLVGRTAGGFATCVAVHIDRYGEVTLANAGHLSPFLGGTVLPTEGAMPLGIVEDCTYAELLFHLPCHERFTLYTDGLLEARSSSGELFGFDRVAALLSTNPPLQGILDAAMRFGQEDDITLLTVVRQA